MEASIKVLMITTEWPTNEFPSHVPFLLKQVELLRSQGIIIDVLHFRSAGNPLNYLKTSWKAFQLLKNNDYNLIHAQWGHSALPVSFSRLPLVVTFRGSDLHGIVDRAGKYTLKGRLLKFVSVKVARRANAVILVSKNLAKSIPSIQSYAIIPSGIDLNLFKPLPKKESRERIGLAPDKKYILFAGSPSRTEKRYPLAAAAVALLNERVKAELIYVENISFDKMPLYMNAVDVLLLTSAHEGSPNVVREALACNTPVVSVDVGDVRERIYDIPGCYICEHEAMDIARGLEKALTQTIVNFEGRKFVQSLDENRMTQEIIKVYQSVL
jgi:teichuronic acid biosynthesis glycosyltransferase TuaC